MRLTSKNAIVIKSIAHELFGKNAIVKLFGSRVDDYRKGGDIDLLVIAAGADFSLIKKLKFKVLLKKQIGDQKIDVIFRDAKQSAGKDDPIFYEASKGVEL